MIAAGMSGAQCPKGRRPDRGQCDTDNHQTPANTGSQQRRRHRALQGPFVGMIMATGAGGTMRMVVGMIMGSVQCLMIGHKNVIL